MVAMYSSVNKEEEEEGEEGNNVSILPSKCPEDIHLLSLLDTWVTPHKLYGDMLCFSSGFFFILCEVNGYHWPPLYWHCVEFFEN